MSFVDAGRDRRASTSGSWTSPARPTCCRSRWTTSTRDGRSPPRRRRRRARGSRAEQPERSRAGAPPAARPRDPASARLRPRGGRRAHPDVGAAGALQRGARAVNWWWVLAVALVPLRIRARRGRGVAHPDVARSRAGPPGGGPSERGDARQDRVRSAAVPERRLPHGDVRAERLGDPRRVPRRARVRRARGSRSPRSCSRSCTSCSSRRWRRRSPSCTPIASRWRSRRSSGSSAASSRSRRAS